MTNLYNYLATWPKESKVVKWPKARAQTNAGAVFLYEFMSLSLEHLSWIGIPYPD